MELSFESWVVVVLGAAGGLVAMLLERHAAVKHAATKAVESHVKAETERKRAVAAEKTRIATGMLALNSDIDRAYRRQMDERFTLGQLEPVPVIDRLALVVTCMGCDSVFGAEAQDGSVDVALTLCPECSKHGPQPMPAPPVVQQPIVMLN